VASGGQNDAERDGAEQAVIATVLELVALRYSTPLTSVFHSSPLPASHKLIPQLESRAAVY